LNTELQLATRDPWQAFEVTGLVDDLRFRGLIHQVTDDALMEKLDAGGLSAYIGFDPTASSLHVGNLLQLCTLRRLQLGGHRPIALAGGGTGFIGDPSGKSDERNLLDVDELAANLEGIRAQIARFLDFSAEAGPTRALLADNGAWLGTVTLVTFLREVGKHVTVNEMIKKDSVRSRIERENQGISYTEFSYMLLQAYDFLRLHQDEGCDLQIGGSDQWGNISLGVEVIGKVTGDHVYGLTTPLVTKADGSKFGKTAAGTVWLDAARTSPYRFYQFFMNTEDSRVGSYLRFFTFLSHDEIAALDAETAQHPEHRAGQRALAAALCDMVHGEAETARAERASAALFGEDIVTLDEATLLDVFDDAPSSALARDALGSSESAGRNVLDVLTAAGLATSKSQARRSVEGGGIYVNNVRVENPERTLSEGDLLAGRYVILRKGRKDFHLLRVE
jgi:tyrosyl-tRNA synthetase